MNPSKSELIESLHKIMCSATSTVSDSRVKNNDYFKRRVLGFRAEMEFEKYVTSQSGVHFLEGGQLISTKLSGASGDKNSFLYATSSFNDPKDFVEIYSVINLWDEVNEQIYIQIKKDDWSLEDFTTRSVNESGKRVEKTEKILVPRCQFYRFNKNTCSFTEHTEQNYNCVLSHFEKSERKPSLFPLRKRDQFDYFQNYNENTLKSIYTNRYFLDVILRKAKGRQIIDLDGFLKTPNGYVIIEIKEKSPIIKGTDTNNWQFGWDSRRILWYLYLKLKIDLPILYNVHEIDNRTDRNFVKWNSIFMEDFLKGTSWSNSRGGGGGEDTLLAPYTFFRPLRTILDELSVTDL